MERIHAVLGDPLLSATDVAMFLGVHRSTVIRLAQKPGGLPCIRFEGNLRFRPEDLREYVAKHFDTSQGRKPRFHPPADSVRESVHETRKSQSATLRSWTPPVA